ncbi:MAG: hypothetical protein Q8O85_11220 [Rhodoferax sp.]|uniref:hypothetical protein n=1 Tax=Rhodoferax sp. TaxID=50421 RepID=UPI002735113E|nr:hypothetical protein [Rhodoferax sp.]MDP2679276.1 hypothetical protein [Rhodoferax sp.]
MRPSLAVALSSKDSLIITIDIASPGQKQDKTLQECDVFDGLCFGLFFRCQLCVGHLNDAHIGLDGASGLLIHKDIS